MKQKQFAIIHHSQMTDTTLYFISNSKQNLLNNENLIYNFIHHETAESFEPLQKELNEKQIFFLNSEDNPEDSKTQNLTIIKYYSYRF
jgi:hypothetical protein